MLQLVLEQTLINFDHLARGGGGGSGGGGGGGSIIILLGYLPTHFIGAVLRRKMKNPIGLTLMIAATLTYGVLWWFLGSVGIIISLAAFLGGPAGYFGWFGKISARVRKKAQRDIVRAESTDKAWNEETLNQHVKSVFMTFQQDWSNFNIDNIKTYLTPAYAAHVELMLAAIKLRQRRNEVENPQIIELFPSEVDDLPGNTNDTVIYYLDASANDKLIENIDGHETKLFEDDSEFYEYWHFVRSGDKWLLDGISQLTEKLFLFNGTIRDFAVSNGMFYSPDWGWLLLPSKGLLFKGGKFGKSDINNHVIGTYHNLLVELYTYFPSLQNQNAKVPQYIIAQVALPKRYDSLIVSAKSGFWSSNLFHKTPKGYNRVQLEWPDFNKRYEVYATDVEQVTAFELLHPVFMEKLFTLPFKISIEVADNVVYLYTTDKHADYATMFSVLQDAFKEMKL